jgi:two-component system, OmpR family, sensor histidine kinase SenX3
VGDEEESVLKRRDHGTGKSQPAFQEGRDPEIRGRLDTAETALEALSDGVVVFDPEGGIGYLNAVARDLIGRRFDRISELAPPALREACREVAVTGSPLELEFETAGRNIQASVVPRSREEGRAFGLVVVLHDITVAKRSDRIRRDFVANASHELKTPVSAITALSEALRDAATRDPIAAERFVALLQDESQRLSRLVGDLLDLSRLEGERPELTTVPMARVVAEETDRLRPSADAAGLRLVVGPLAEASVLGAEADLGLLVNNLVDNAVHYTPHGGEVRVSLSIEGETAVLEVVDTGMGIASRDLDRIFERFYRADPARSRQTGGTGLGLSIVRHVAELHGGEVLVRSVLGSGSTFTVVLPVVREPASELAGSAEAQASL